MTAGCISFKNRDFLPVYAFSVHGKEGRGFIHVFPFKFDEVGDQERHRLAEQADHADRFGVRNLLAFWSNLEKGYRLFNETRRIPRVTLPSKNIYQVGDSDPYVGAIQTALGLKGKADMEFTEEVKIALVAFQQQSNLTADGIAGPKTLRALGLYPLKYVFE